MCYYFEWDSPFLYQCEYLDGISESDSSQAPSYFSPKKMQQPSRAIKNEIIALVFLVNTVVILGRRIHWHNVISLNGICGSSDCQPPWCQLRQHASNRRFSSPFYCHRLRSVSPGQCMDFLPCFRLRLQSSCHIWSCYSRRYPPASRRTFCCCSDPWRNHGGRACRWTNSRTITR